MQQSQQAVAAAQAQAQAAAAAAAQLRVSSSVPPNPVLADSELMATGALPPAQHAAAIVVQQHPHHPHHHQHHHPQHQQQQQHHQNQVVGASYMTEPPPPILAVAPNDRRFRTVSEKSVTESNLSSDAEPFVYTGSSSSINSLHQAPPPSVPSSLAAGAAVVESSSGGIGSSTAESADRRDAESLPPAGDERQGKPEEGATTDPTTVHDDDEQNANVPQQRSSDSNAVVDQHADDAADTLSEAVANLNIGVDEKKALLARTEAEVESPAQPAVAPVGQTDGAEMEVHTTTDGMGADDGGVASDETDRVAVGMADGSATTKKKKVPT